MGGDKAVEFNESDGGGKNHQNRGDVVGKHYRSLLLCWQLLLVINT